MAAAKSATTKKTSVSSVGAPAQHNQSSRKGKKSWRKNVSIEDVEEGLDQIRSEERAIGKPLQKVDDGELFQIDVKGDDTIRKSVPRFSSSQLTSAKILAQRSAVPAVFSRTASVKRKSISHEDKTRLLQITKRHRKGPLNTVIESTSSAPLELSEAVKQSGRYDAWVEPEVVEIPDGLETVQPKIVKPPRHDNLKDAIEVPAVAAPHLGTSYNPPMQAHQELLLKAHEIEEKRVKEAELLAEAKDKMRRAELDVDQAEGIPLGMKLDVGENDEGEEEDAQETLIQRKMPGRKTKKQRRKAEKQREEKRLLAEKAAKKRMLETVNSAKSLQKATEQTFQARQKALEARRLLLRQKLKGGMAGQRLGKHKVPEGDIDVQLGEDLSESLRGLKPEGNLFRDRFQSLQQRALIEPRVPVLPKKRKNKTKEYEKHAYKRFDRAQA